MSDNHPARVLEPNDEIDIFELVATIWQEKWLVVATTFIIAGLALLYVLFATPVYQVQTSLTKSQVADLDPINVPDIYSLTPSQALYRVGERLKSYETRFDFFKNHQALFKEFVDPNQTIEQNFQRFNRDHIKVKNTELDDKGVSLGEPVSMQITYAKGLDGVAIANGLTQTAINRERERIAASIKALKARHINNVERNINADRAGYDTKKEVQITQLSEDDSLKKLQLNDELKALRASLKEQRENRIKKLDEAIHIATSLGIQKPTTPSSMSQANTHASGNVIKTEVNNQKIPLYFMGTKALKAERKTLLARKSDDFTSSRIVAIKSKLALLQHNRKIETLKNRQNENLFLTELPALQKQLKKLQDISVDMSKVKLVSLDQSATTPLKPIKPKKLLIMAAAIFLGGLLGVFIALIRGLARKRYGLSES